MNLDSYLARYLDKRMSRIIDEWQISTRNDMADLTRRYHRVQDDLAGLKSFEHEAEARLTVLEERIRRLKEQKK